MMKQTKIFTFIAEIMSAYRKIDNDMMQYLKIFIPEKFIDIDCQLSAGGII